MRFTVAAALTLIAGCNTRPSDRDYSPPAQTQAGDDAPDEVAVTGGGLVSSKPLSRALGGEGPLMKRLAADRTGVNFVAPIDGSHPLRRLYVGGFFSGSVAIGDIDGDGLPDLHFASGPGKNGLFRQTGDFRFEDITERAGVDGGGAWGVGASMVDIDNDGDLDIYVCNYDSPNLLYLNQGDATFVEAARRFRLDIVDCCLLPTFCDYDNDGDLDCYLMTNRYYRAGGLPTDMKLIVKGGKLYLPKQYQKYYGIRTTGRNRGELEFIGRPDRLLRNNGDGTFSDVTKEAGISTRPGHGLSATWWDYNGDGQCDLYVGNDFNDPDHLYRNNSDGTFTDVIAETVPHTTWFSMGADFGDINNDGLFDFLVADMSPTTHLGQKTTMGAMNRLKWFLETAWPRQYMRNALYLNTGTQRFMEAAYLTGLDSTDWTWSPKFGDLDNDGRLDVFFTNGMVRNLNDSDRPFTVGHQMGREKWELYKDLPAMPEQNLAFRNEGDLQFTDVSQAWGLDHVGLSYAAAWGDLDGDGDLDLVVSNLAEPVGIYRNQSSSGHRVTIQLRGTRSNRWGVGAVVRLETAGGQQARQLIPMTGYLGGNQPLIHFGLGHDSAIRELTVHWPSGHRQTVANLPADRLYTITESDQPPTPPTAPPTQTTLFVRSKALAGARHRETAFDDYKRQPLLPSKLSQLGPGVACGDVDGDGDDDIFLAGAAGQSGALYFNHEGRFTSRGPSPFNRDAACEDMAPLFFDADSDGDLDLYVTSGGVECEPEDDVLMDRLYLNDGRGIFVKAPAGTLPQLRDSSGVVAASDFDHDGDLDLFVGGRVIPGKYPLAPRSHLLRNDGGRFADVTEHLAPKLTRPGLVTGAIWSDADGDGWVDLLVTHEWGPVKLFGNRRGRLVDQTEQAGLDKWLGWWNGIAARDLDGDGDIDYVVTNFGLNSKYRATQQNPATLFYGDFENSGEMRLVEAEFEGRELYPVRGRRCSTEAMPFLKDKFTSYRGFATATLEEIYTAECLQRSRRYAATTLSSGVLINAEAGRFEFHPLPNLAQISPSFGVVLTEIDGDGNADIYLVQNFFSPQAETGRMDGGLSLLLRGNGDGTFDPIWPASSGLAVAGDAKGLAATDFNVDGWPDLIVGVNDDEVAAFENQGSDDLRVLTLRLEGPPGNPVAVGARVTVYLTHGPPQSAEVHAGSGYLSQSTSALTFGIGNDGKVDRIEIVWPDGSRSVHRVAPTQQNVVIRHSEV